MTPYRPLFVTGTARSGSDLISMMLSTNREVMIALDPFLEVFRSMRNAFVRRYAPPNVVASFDPSAPIQDYYFVDERIALMDAVQHGDLATPFEEDWETFAARGAQRCALECADLAPHYREIRGRTYADLIANGLAMIADVRDVVRRKWVGYKDVWTIEFFRPLAVAFPDARFIIIRRDPRATVNSNLGGLKRDPASVAEALSYVRHWRKYVAFTVHYQNDPLFKDRLFVVGHEDLLREPERTARKMCEFLEVMYDPAMLDTDRYVDPATGATWRGNSTFEAVTSGISVHRAERWRSMLDPRVAKMIEFTCGHDMKLMGDGPLYHYELQGQWPSGDILEFLLEHVERSWNWRTDLGDPQRDWGFELFRRSLLDLPRAPEDRGLIRRSFLFVDVYERLRHVDV